MKIQRAYKTELDPNNRQCAALLRHAGAARFVYNWGLRRTAGEGGHRRAREAARLAHVAAATRQIRPVRVAVAQLLLGVDAAPHMRPAQDAFMPGHRDAVRHVWTSRDSP